MMRILAPLAICAALASPAMAEQRALSGFTGVSANAGTDVEVVVGPSFSVDVTGRDAARVVTRISGSTLVVEPVRTMWFQHGPRDAHVRVTMPHVSALEASSGADLRASGLNGGDVSLDSSSGADLYASGACASFTADASSGADIHAQDLRCENGSVDVSSGADARVYASGRLNVDASSGGGVIAYGNPGIGSIDLSSGGSLRRAN